MFKNISSFIRIKPALAVAFLYATSSLLFGTWVASIPGIKERFGFSDGSLGMSLLLSPLGAVTAMLLSTRIFSKVQVGKWMFYGYLCQCTVMIFQINSLNRIMFWGCLYCYGFNSFLNGVSINATVNNMEKKYNRLMMSTCHSMYSLGGGVSAILAAFWFSIHVPSGWQIVIIVAAIVTVNYANRNYLLGNKEIIHSRSSFKLPSLGILGIAFICLVSYMAEGCVADWSAIYLKETMHAPKAMISLGYAGFSFAMTFGRLNGDSLVGRFGSKKVVITGCLIAATGFLTVVTAWLIPIVIAGYILIGLGCCCIVPVLFRASAHIPGISTVEGFAMVTTGGLIGFLTGPSVIGFIAEKTNLSKALSLLIFMTLLSAIVAWRSRFITNKKKMEKIQIAFDEQTY